MFSKLYKGLVIHGYCDKPECKVMFESGGKSELRHFKSFRAAQMAITKFLK